MYVKKTRIFANLYPLNLNAAAARRASIVSRFGENNSDENIEFICCLIFDAGVIMYKMFYCLFVSSSKKD